MSTRSHVECTDGHVDAELLSRLGLDGRHDFFGWCGKKILDTDWSELNSSRSKGSLRSSKVLLNCPQRDFKALIHFDTSNFQNALNPAALPSLFPINRRTWDLWPQNLFCQSSQDVRNCLVPRLLWWLCEVNFRPWPGLPQRLLCVPAKLAAAKCMWPEQVDNDF